LLAQRYRLERRLAQGGMAEVWLGTDLQLSRQVAVKLLKPGLAIDPVVAERFRREAIAVAQLNHPSIVAVYDAVEEPVDGQPGVYRQAVVMQLVNGKSLRQLLDEQKRLSPDLTMHIGVCVASALDAAHQANLVHRDVKPANILITPDGRVLLTDFGIAKGLDGGDDLTSANIMMGTAKYLSPEQVRGKRLDGRADLYSLGLVLYECLAGRVPFLGETDTDTALARLNRDPTDLARLRPTLPSGLAALIHKLLARRPDQRYATGAEVRAELNRVIEWARANPRGMDHTGTPPRGAPGSTPPGGTATQTNGSTPPRGSGYRPAPVPARGPSAGQTTGRPAGAAQRAPGARDRTPPSPSRPRQQPNRTFDNRPTTSSFVVGGLLLVALILAIVLWRAMTDDDPTSQGPLQVPDSTVIPDGSVVPLPDAGGAAQIAAVASFDPGGDGDERPDLEAAAWDGDPNSSWKTLCYEDRFVNGKPGVGLVANLTRQASGTIAATIASAPYQVKIFASASDRAPATVDGWGEPITNGADTEPGVVQGSFPAGTRHLLVLLVELGPDAACENPYRGQIAELTVG
jgi:serine/threonine-protein kinase